MKITLANLHLATAQQVFDQVVEHLRQQGQKSITFDEGRGKTVCLYRNPEGLSCAAGCLMSDAEYRISFENQTWGGLVSEGFTIDRHSYLITELQEIHDGQNADKWEEHFERLAKSYHLVYTPLCKEV